MILSIVTGTYNRLPFLQRMIQSIRAQMPRHMEYEIIVVNGPSTDGTKEWLWDQKDCKLINHHDLRGAIPAFCEGARAARGQYVLLANDDIIFHPYSILAALAYLDSHPDAGGVAFADNRSAQRGRANGHQVEGMSAIGTDGKPTGVPYAQVGLFRHWLGERVGWWGDDDPVMKGARTYGGDNYLSARIWELGYSIVAIPACRIDDLIPADELRVHNEAKAYQDGIQYYHRFPYGPQLQHGPQVRNPQTEHLRIVVMPIYEPSFPGRLNKEYGLSEALAARGWCYEIDFVNEAFDLAAIVHHFQPHLLVTQLHGVNEINAPLLAAAKEAKPDLLIVNWNGDAHEKGLISPEILECLRHVDLQTVVNAKVLPVYQQEGIKAAYWQIAYKDPVAPYQGQARSHQVLFLGNCYNEERHAIVNAIRSVGVDVGIYGSCPHATGNTHYDFAHSRALYEHCTIAISDVFPNTVGFVSNRLLQALSAGAFVLQQHNEGLSEYNGFVEGTHYITWQSPTDLPDLIRLWLSPEKEGERKRIAQAGKEYVRENFSADAQVSKLFDLIRELL